MCTGDIGVLLNDEAMSTNMAMLHENIRLAIDDDRRAKQSNGRSIEEHGSDLHQG